MSFGVDVGDDSCASFLIIIWSGDGMFSTPVGNGASMMPNRSGERTDLCGELLLVSITGRRSGDNREENILLLTS